MTSRVRGLSLLITCSLVAFLLGSVGTAVAGPGLTEKAVAKIAGKVVKKKARSLSVRNAERLGGKPAAAYRDDATVYSVEISTPASIREITVPLGPGNYQIAYSAYLPGGSGSTFCQVERNRGGAKLLTADDGYQGFGPSVSAIGFVDVQSGDTVLLRCSSGGSWNTAPNEPIQIVATRLDSSTDVPLTARVGRGTGR